VNCKQYFLQCFLLSRWLTVSTAIPGSSRSYHVRILLEGGFITAMDQGSLSNGPYWLPQRLTYKGHEFLDTIRDGKVWNLTKDAVKEVSGASLQVLLEVAKCFAKQHLAEHGVHLG
jgi:hypothetical protein